MVGFQGTKLFRLLPLDLCVLPIHKAAYLLIDDGAAFVATKDGKLFGQIKVPIMNARIAILLRLTCALGAASLLFGCATPPNPQTFQQYATAVQTAGDSVDQAMLQDVSWSQDEYENSVLEGAVTLQHTAILVRQAPYTALFPNSDGLTNVPTFYQLQNARLTLLQLNAAVEKYVNLLAQLSGNGAINTNTFETMAKETDANLNAIATTLNVKAPNGSIAIFSVASAEILNLIIENKRDEALAQLLTTNQPAIDNYCNSCLKLLGILDGALFTDYRSKAMALDGAFEAVPKDQRTTDPKALQAVQQLIQLNSNYLALLQILKSTKNVYETLPQGHRELLNSLQTKQTSLAAIENLYQEGQQLKTVYTELNQSTKPNNK